VFKKFYNLSGSPFLLTPDSLGADDSRGLLERIEMLERSAFPQGQVFKRVMDFLEANVAGQL
jgi:hypothetical protein